MSKLNFMSITMSGRDWQKFSELPYATKSLYLKMQKAFHMTLTGSVGWKSLFHCLRYQVPPAHLAVLCLASFIYKHQSKQKFIYIETSGQSKIAAAVFPAEQVNFLQVIKERKEKEFWRFTQIVIKYEFHLGCSAWVTNYKPLFCCWEGIKVTYYHLDNGWSTEKWFSAEGITHPPIKTHLLLVATKPLRGDFARVRKE